MAVSKRLRYEILRRDGNRCRYCGGKAPDVALTIDHVIPEALGGTDDPNNLVAACVDCNGGKSSASPDAALVAEVSDSAVKWAAAMKRAAEENKLNDNTAVYEAVVNAWSSFRRNRIPADYRETIDQFLNAGLPADDIVQMAHVADAKPSIYNRWSYFCGCCWTRIRQLQDIAAEIMSGDEAKIHPTEVAEDDPYEEHPETARGWFKSVWYQTAWTNGHRQRRSIHPDYLAQARAESIEDGRTPDDYGYVDEEGMLHCTNVPRPIETFFSDVDHFLAQGLGRSQIEENVSEAMRAPIDNVDRWNYFMACCQRDVSGDA